MKRCRICKNEFYGEEVRCLVCGSLLPQTDIPMSFEKNGRLVKICSCCGKTNLPSSIRCESCNMFLGKSQTVGSNRADDGVVLVAELETGERISLKNNDIIGRSYQPGLWDAYTPRALYRVCLSGNEPMLENLKYRRKIKLYYNEPYHAGRKTFRFITEE